MFPSPGRGTILRASLRRRLSSRERVSARRPRASTARAHAPGSASRRAPRWRSRSRAPRAAWRSCPGACSTSWSRTRPCGASWRRTSASRPESSSPPLPELPRERPLSIFVSCAEASGELHALHLVRALRAELAAAGAPPPRIAGLGGAAAGGRGRRAPGRAGRARRDGLRRHAARAALLPGAARGAPRGASRDEPPDVVVPVDSPALHVPLARIAQALRPLRRAPRLAAVLGLGPLARAAPTARPSTARSRSCPSSPPGSRAAASRWRTSATRCSTSSPRCPPRRGGRRARPSRASWRCSRAAARP